MENHKCWLAALVIAGAIVAGIDYAHAADYGYARPPGPPNVIYEPPPVILAPVDRCRHETVRKYDEDGDFQGTEEKETCD